MVKPIMINVGNVESFEPDDLKANFFYVGREFKGWPASALGNPFPLAKHDNDRAKVLELYKAWLFEKIVKADYEDQAYNFLGEISRMALTCDVTLLCWCFPKPDNHVGCWCHAEIVKQALEWLHGPWNPDHADFMSFLMPSDYWIEEAPILIELPVRQKKISIPMF